MRADPTFWVTAREVCTAKQIRVLELRELHGFSLRQISYVTDTSLTTVRDTLDAAHRKIERAREREAS